MAKKLTRFLVELSQDPDLLQEFYDDRPKALQGKGLKPEHRQALLDGDLAAIQGFVQEETGDVSRWTMVPINSPPYR